MKRWSVSSCAWGMEPVSGRRWPSMGVSPIVGLARTITRSAFGSPYGQQGSREFLEAGTHALPGHVDNLKLVVRPAPSEARDQTAMRQAIEAGQPPSEHDRRVIQSHR
jgi:hypothetical protein